MIDRIIAVLHGIPEAAIIVIISALPVVELRGAIPYGIAVAKLPVWSVFWLAVLGNILPALPLLYALEPLSRRLRHIPLTRAFFEWLFERSRRKADLIERYEIAGLILFVAIPLPMTGAWTGCIAASLLGLNKVRSFAAICIGVCIAAVVVTVLSVGIKGLL